MWDRWAPTGYKMDWQHAPRQSGLPIGYFDRAPRWPVVLAAALFGALLLLGAGG